MVWKYKVQATNNKSQDSNIAASNNNNNNNNMNMNMNIGSVAPKMPSIGCSYDSIFIILYTHTLTHWPMIIYPISRQNATRKKQAKKLTKTHKHTKLDTE